MNVVASSVIRSSRQGESHGGLYLVDLESGEFTRRFDWDSPEIDWGGRGGDRGLRGIVFWRDQMVVAASDELFFFDADFRILDRLRHPILRHCHEMSISDGILHITSTGFDSVLTLDLEARTFVDGFCIRFPLTGGKVAKAIGARLTPVVERFDPNGDRLPDPGDTTHINFVDAFPEGGFSVSGTRMGYLLEVSPQGAIVRKRKIPFGTHNARRWGQDGVLCNSTADHVVGVFDGRGRQQECVEIPTYDPETLSGTGVPRDHARQGFGRGLAVLDEAGPVVVVGSSPATVSIIDLGSQRVELSIQLSKDVRNAIHGLEIWPFSR